MENGSFVEKHFAYHGQGRASSGSIYYYVDAGEKTEFHRIDCDEYWCYVQGASLEIWQVSECGRLSVSQLGVEEGCDPFVYVPKGTIFASRHGKTVEDGTFLICLTVPRFTYDGFEMFKQEQMTEICPESEAFFR